MVVGECDDCSGENDIKLTDDPYKAIAGEKNPPSYSGSWEFVDCPNEFSPGPPKVIIKKGSSEYWWPVQPDNFASPVTGMEIIILKEKHTLEFGNKGELFQDTEHKKDIITTFFLHRIDAHDVNMMSF